jgi:hypothetical protein
MSTSRTPGFIAILRRSLTALALVAVVGGATAAPALADDDWHHGWRGHDEGNRGWHGHDEWREHAWREHMWRERERERAWREHEWRLRHQPGYYGYYQAPGYVYAPPPVAYAPPSLNVVIPFR